MTKLKSTRSAAFAVFWYLITCTPSVLGAPATPPLVGANVNMVTGTKWPAGDPLLNKQNEGSLAVSSVNPQHLLGGANDYRLVNPVTPVAGGEAGADAWIAVTPPALESRLPTMKERKNVPYGPGRTVGSAANCSPFAGEG